MNWWPLLGVALVVAGFVARLNPVLVVVASGFATGLLAGISPLAVLELLTLPAAPSSGSSIT